MQRHSMSHQQILQQKSIQANIHNEEVLEKFEQHIQDTKQSVFELQQDTMRKLDQENSQIKDYEKSKAKEIK